MMTDFFKHHRNKNLLFDLRDKNELDRFIKACPEGTVTMVDSEENPGENIYGLNDFILIKDYLFTTEKE
jgi:hypothetical protein